MTLTERDLTLGNVQIEVIDSLLIMLEKEHDKYHVKAYTMHKHYDFAIRRHKSTWDDYESAQKEFNKLITGGN